MAKLENVKTIDMVNGEITKVAYEGAEYAKVNGEAQVGDLIQAKRTALDTTKDAFYKIIEVSESGFSYSDDENDSHDWDYDGSYELFRKISTPANPSLESRVETLEAEVKELNCKGAEAAPTYRLIAKEDAQAGDFVKFAKGQWDVTAGKMYEIINVDEDGDYEFKDDAGDVRCAIVGGSEEFEVFTLREKEAEPKPAPLQVGDYAKVVAKHTESYGASVGEIVKVVGENSSYNGFRTESMSGNNWGGNPNCSAICLVKATEEEVAKAKAELAERAEAERWAKIGRKPNEFKKGDIVQSKEFPSEVGTVGEINGKFRDIRYYVNFGEKGYGICTEKPENIELITPVEARFDKEADSVA